MSSVNIACFNDLSDLPLCKTETEAESRVKDFASLLKKVREHTGIVKVRHNSDLTTIRLTETMTLQDYCNTHLPNPLAILLLSIFTKPYVDENDDITLQSYIDTKAAVQFDGGTSASAEGFNAAYCQRTFCVGFDSGEFGQGDFFTLEIVSDGHVKHERWACISSLLFYSALDEHAWRRPAFDAWLQAVQPVRLIESDIVPGRKKIALQDHHGKDKMTEHARSLCNSPYVEAVLTTLPFRRSARNYVDRITDDGLVDIVMWWEEDGYSMRVKTTGRTVAETREIARLLKERYGRG